MVGLEAGRTVRSSRTRATGRPVARTNQSRGGVVPFARVPANPEVRITHPPVHFAMLLVLILVAYLQRVSLFVPNLVFGR